MQEVSGSIPLGSTIPLIGIRRHGFGWNSRQKANPL